MKTADIISTTGTAAANAGNSFQNGQYAEGASYLVGGAASAIPDEKAAYYVDAYGNAIVTGVDHGLENGAVAGVGTGLTAAHDATINYG